MEGEEESALVQAPAAANRPATARITKVRRGIHGPLLDSRRAPARWTTPQRYSVAGGESPPSVRGLSDNTPAGILGPATVLRRATRVAQPARTGEGARILGRVPSRRSSNPSRLAGRVAGNPIDRWAG